MLARLGSGKEATMKVFAVIALACAAALGAQKAPVDWVNTLVGTASLDRQDFIGNAPPTVGGFPPLTRRSRITPS